MYENPLGSDACAGSTPARGTNQTQESRPNGRLSVYQHIHPFLFSLQKYYKKMTYASLYAIFLIFSSRSHAFS